MRGAALALALAACAAPADAASVFTGKVTDEKGKPLASVTVQLVDRFTEAVIASAVTDGVGVYNLSTTGNSTYTLRAAPVGYFPAQSPLRFLPSGGNIPVDFALQALDEGWRDDFATAAAPPTGWSATYSATQFASDGNIMLFRTDVFGGSGVYQGVTKAIGSTLSNTQYPFTSIRSSYSLTAGSFGSIHFIFDHSGGWNQRVGLIDDPAQPYRWKDRTYPTLSNIDTAFLLQGDGPAAQNNAVSHYYDYIIIHARDRGFFRGTVRDQDGNPMAGERVQVRVGTYTVAEAVSAADGVYEVWVGTATSFYAVRSAKAGYVTASTGGQSVTGRTQTTVDPVLAPLPSNLQFTAASSASVSMSWTLSRPAAHTPVVVVSTSADFTALVASGTGSLGQQTTTWAVPWDNTTYYFKVKVFEDPDNQFSSPVSTVNAAAAPTDIRFDAVSSHSITASAYAYGTAFSSMGAGSSGIDIARDGAYAGWKSEAWLTRFNLTSPRQALAGASLGGRVYALGGQNGGPLATVESYDPVVNAWSFKANIVARYGLGAAVAGGKIYAVGGYTGVSPSDAVEEYDPEKDAWTPRAKLPVARYALSVAAFGGKVYAIAGNNGGYLGNNDEYDPQTDTWTARAPLSPPRGYAAEAVLDGKIHLVGGTDGTRSALNSVYDPLADSWQTKASLPAPRQDAEVVALGGKLHLFGGEGDAGYADTAAQYDPQADTWTARSPLPLLRAQLGAAVLDGRIHLFGGSNGAAQSDHRVFDPAFAASFSGLAPNKEYFFKARARNSAGTETAESPLISTYTLAVATVPQPGTDLFSGVAGTSVTVSWSSGTDAGGFNGPGASYLLQASTMPTFLPVASSSLTFALSATLGDLAAPNSTYYFRLRAYNAAGVTDHTWLVLGSTASAIEAPTWVEVEQSSAGALTVSAYAARFSSHSVGLSATAVAVDGAWGPWKKPAWTLRGSLAPARYKLAACAARGRVYAIGGTSDGTTPLSLAESFDPVLGAWTVVGSLNAARYELACAEAGGKLYAVGGYASVEEKTTEVYDPETNAWTRRRDMPEAKFSLAAAGAGGKVYAMGGFNAGARKTAAVYDPDADSWSALADMPGPLFRTAGASAQGKVYVLGGSPDGGSRSGALYEFDPAGGWTSRAAMPTAREFLAAAGAGGKVYALGGTIGSLSAAAESFDPVSNAWVKHASMTVARQMLGAAALHGRLYAVGGHNGAGLGTTEEFDPGVSSSFTLLTPNTLYGFKAKARNVFGAETAESPTVSTYTLAVATTANWSDTVTAASSVSLTVNWSSGSDVVGYNGPGASYLVHASTTATFLPVAGSSLTRNLFAVVSGLSVADTTHYLRVRAYNAADVTDHSWFVLGSTYVAAPSTPSAVSAGPSGSSNTLRVRWTTPGSNGMAGTLEAGSEFRVQWSSLPFAATVWSTANAQVVIATGPVAAGSQVSTDVAHLPALSTVSFRVWAANAAGMWSPPSVATTTVVSPFSYAPAVAEAAALGQSIGLAVDRGGDLHVVFQDDTLPGLRYARRTGGVWGAPQTAFSGTVADVVAAVDVDGVVHAAYRDVALSALAYARYDGTWSSATVHSLANASPGGIVVDPRGRVMISYGDYNDGDLRFAQGSGSSWATDAVDTAGMPLNGVGNSLALDGRGNPHIAYTLPTGGSSSYNLKYASRSADGLWSISEIRPQAENLSLPTLNLDRDGRPRITYYRYSSVDSIFYVTDAGSGWIPPVLVGKTANGFASAALDGNGGLHASYFLQPGDDLVYSYSGDGGASWSSHTVDADGFIGYPAQPIAVDSAGAVHIVYRDGTNTDVKGAAWEPGAFGAAFGGRPGSAAQAPTAFDGHALGASSIAFSWIDGATNELGFSVYLTSAGSPNQSFVVAVGSTVLGASGGAGTVRSLNLTGLSANTSYQAYVAAIGNGGVVLSSASKVIYTPVETPTALYFDEVSTAAITAAAYAPGAGFSNLHRGLSGVAVARDGVWADWGAAAWTTRGAGAQRYGLAAAVVGGRLHAVGGDNFGKLATNEVYDPVTNAWAVRDPLDIQRSYLGLAAAGGRLYAVGGQGMATTVSFNEEYDPVADAWTTRAPMTKARHSLAVVAVGGKVYAIGGADGAAMGDNEEYDPAADTWTARALLSPSRSGAAGTVLEGRVYVVGGAASALVNAYDPVADQWSSRAAMSVSRQSPAVGAVGGKIYALGGFGSTYESTVEVYDSTANAWAAHPLPMPTPRSDAGSAVLGGKVFVVAGTNGSGMSSVAVFDPGTASTFTALTPNKEYFFKAKARGIDGAETAETAVVSTYTLAAATVPQNGGELFAAVHPSSASVAWSSGTEAGGYNGPGATYLAAVSTTAAFLPTAASSMTANTFAFFESLTPNTTHWFRVRAYNALGATDHSWTGLGSTVTPAATPASAASTFTAVSAAEMSVRWSANGNPLGLTTYTVVLTTGPVYPNAYSGNLVLSTAPAGADPAATVNGTLQVNATYHLFVAAVHRMGGETEYAALGATSSLANSPGSLGAGWPFYAPGSSSMTVRFWGSGNPFQSTTYTVTLSTVNGETAPAQDRVVLSTSPQELADDHFATLTGLSANSTYYLFVTALNHSGVGTAGVAFGSTVTAIETPDTVEVVSVSTYGLVAVASTTAVGFSSITAGLSGTNLELGGVYMGWVSGSSVTVSTGLPPNTGFSLRAKARNAAGVETDASPVVSTYTLAAATLPAGGLPPVAVVAATWTSVRWSSGTDSGGYNGPGASYRVEASTMPGFDPVMASSTTFALDAVLDGLQPDATVHLRLRAFNSLGAPGDWLSLGSTVTLARTPVSAASTFTMVGASSMTVAWGADGNAPGTAYRVVLTTYLPYSQAHVTASTAPFGAVELTAEGLFPNSTYYPIVTALNRAGVASPEYHAGSTVTAIETPESVVFEAVSTHSVVAVASTTAVGFSSAAVGLSGTNISQGGVYRGWVSGSSVAFSTGLPPNALLSFRAKARNSLGVETAESPAFSTYTLAAATLPAAGASPFDAVAATWTSVRWASGTDAGGYNGPGATYRLEASTWSGFNEVLASSVTANPFATLAGLAPNATHYFRVRAYTAAGGPGDWLALGSTVTAIESPAVFVDEVSSSAIVASAYAANPGFSNLTVGPSATNVSLDGTWGGWRSERWSTMAPLAGRARWFGASVEHGGFVYVAGGHDGAWQRWLDRYDPVSGQWAALADMSNQNGNFGLAATTGSLHAVAGQAAGPMLLIHEVFDIAAGAWSSKADLPVTRGGGELKAVGVPGGFMLVGDSASPMARRYDEAAGSWTVLAAPTGIGSLMQLARGGGKVFALSGSVLRIFDEGLGTWSSGAAMPSSDGYDPVVAFIGGKLYATGGTGVVRTRVYDPATDSWELRSNLPTGRSSPLGAGARGRIYVTGGSPGAGVSPVTEEFDPGVASSFTALAPNTLYTLTAKARNALAVETAESPSVSTYTLAAVPAAHALPFPEVFLSSVSAQWNANGNPSPATPYRLEASTASDFNAAASSSAVEWQTALATSAAGLFGNTTYYFRVKARNAYGHETAYLTLGSTVTAAFTPESAASTYSAVGSTVLTVSWAGGGNGAGTLYQAVLSTEPLPNANADNLVVSSRPAGALSAELTGLSANATYYAAVRAVSHSGGVTPLLLLGSTVTLPAPPASAPSTFSAVAESSFTAHWDGNGNAAGTRYEVVAATTAALDLADPANRTVSTAPYGLPAAVVPGLASNATYYLFVAARARAGALGSYAALGSTVTLPAAPGSAASTFTAVGSTDASVAWSDGGNAAGTRYRVVLSTQTPLTALPGNAEVATDAAGGLTAALAGLVPNTTYHLFVAAQGRTAGESAFSALGSTVTAIETPAGVYFTALSSDALVAVASAPGGAFTNLGQGLSAVDIALGGSFAGWVSGSSVTAFSGLTPNTAYLLRARARNAAGRPTAESADASTRTLAAVPSTATPGFAGLAATSAAVSWTSAGNPAATEYLLEVSTAADWTGQADALFGWAAGTGAAATGLSPNASYYFQVKARNADGVETAFRDLGSTVTLAAEPGPPAGSTFTAVEAGSITVSWGLGGNPAETQFQAAASTAGDFSGSVFLSGWLAGQTTAVHGLAADTTYHWLVTARNRLGAVSAPRPMGAQATAPLPPAASTEPFHRAWVSSAVVQWEPGGNPPTTQYRVEASTAAGFGGTLLDSGWVASLSTTVAGLTGDTTYHFRVRARGASGVLTAPLSLGTTATGAADPFGPAVAWAGPGAARLEWSAAGNREAEGTGAWATRTALPAARERHAAAVVGGRVFVVGGLVSGSASAEVWSAALNADGTLGAWRREADLPAPRESHALAVFAGRLYVLGGFDGSAKATVWSADVQTDGRVAAWKNEVALPAARYRLAAAASGGWLYAFGGDNGVVSQGTVYRAALEGNGRVGAWAAATALPAARNSHAAAAVNGRVYVAGGLGAGVEEEVWSAALAGPAVGAWRTETALPSGLFRHALLATGGSLVAVGGHDGAAAQTVLLSAALASDGTLGSWRTAGAVPLTRFGHAAVLNGPDLFVLGGADDSFVAADSLQTRLAGTQYLVESAEDGGFSVGYASSGWRAGAGAEVPGLTPNRTYHFRVTARSRAGLAGSPAVAGSTLTPAAMPQTAASTFSLVEAGSATLTWTDGGNPAGTEFLAAVSTAPEFSTALMTGWTTGVSSAVHGLEPNTTYYAVAVARDSAGRQSREAYLGSTVTAAAVPAAPGFPSVLTTGLSVAWSTAGNPAGTRYEAELSLSPGFSPPAASSVTLSSGAAFSGLLSASTYYLRVRAFNRLGTPTAYSAATAAVTGADFTAPDAPSGFGLHATPTPGVLLAAWTAPGDDGSSGVLPAGSRFYLQWTAADPASVAWSTANAQLSASTGPLSPGAPASLLVTGVTAGASVYARVWALDESDNASAPSAVAGVWASPFSRTRLDGASDDAGRWVSLALDRNGDAHAAYTAGSAAQELRYLKRSGGVWSVAEAPDPGVPAEEAVLAVGASVPQVVYRNSSTGQLRHARRGAGWTAATVAAGDLRPGGLALDATEFAHVSYYDAGLPGLRYARWTGAAWETETVDAGGGRGRFSSLALDGAGAAHIAYYDAAAADLKYASRTAAGAWAVSTVDAGVDAGSTPVVALDASGHALVFYVDGAAKDLRLARHDGASWSLSPVDTARDVTGVRAAALDGAGRAVVTYYDAAAGDLVFARHNGVGWETGALDSYGDAGAWSALAVEADGALLELHHHAGSGDLLAGSWAAGLPAPLAGNPRGRVGAPSAFSGVVASSTTVQWTWTDSAAGELGWRLYGALSSTGPFSVVAGTTALPGTAGTGTSRLYSESGLSAHTTYYRYVAAVSSGGVVLSPMAAVFPYNTQDLTPPVITNNQGPDPFWRRAAGTLYDVDFADAGGSALSKFQVKASTNPGGAGPDLSPYVDVAVNILANSYTADWALPAAVFNAMLDGTTNWVTVRVLDGGGNEAVLGGAFSVMKDTTPPSFAVAQAGDAQRRAAGGTLYDADARDGASGLERLQYSVSTSPFVADAAVLGWTDVPLAGATTAFTADWAVDFAALKGDATNFVSLRSWDRAGSTAALADAFFVVKDTGGPRVALTAPASAFRSVLTALAGTAADAAGVGGVQVALQETAGGTWYDGAAFSGGGPFWLSAAGTAAWTFASLPALADGTAYRAVARATDTLGNLSVDYSTADFTMDAAAPSAAVTAPADGATVSALAALAGTAADPGGTPSGLAAVEVRVRRVSDGLYWQWPTAAWGTSDLSTSPVAGASWSMALPEALRASLAAGASYFVSARAVDAAVPANLGSLAVGSTFTWADAAAPDAVTNLSALTGPSPGTLDLSWTAPGDDGSSGDLLLGTYRIHYSTDPAAAFSTAAAQVAFSTAALSPGARQWRRLSGLSAGATYHLRVFLADDAGNWSALSNGATAFAGVQPANKILGHVMKSSSEGVTAVKLEAYDASDIRVSQAFSLADGSGTFSLDNVPDGVFRIQATWTADDITSSVWLDGVAVGSYDVDFMLEIAYTLSTLTGTVGSTGASAPAGFLVKAAENGYADSRIELMRAGTTVAQVRPDRTGRWSIPNLLPGRYAVRAYNGFEYTEPQDVQLGEGETKEVVFAFDPLPEASVFAFPNPARRATTVRFVSALPGLEAQVLIFDIAGVAVRELPGSRFTAKPGGVYHAEWDLTNDRGEGVASGVYLFMVKVKGSNGQTGKVVKKLAVVR